MGEFNMKGLVFIFALIALTGARGQFVDKKGRYTPTPPKGDSKEKAFTGADNFDTSISADPSGGNYGSGSYGSDSYGQGKEDNLSGDVSKCSYDAAIEACRAKRGGYGWTCSDEWVKDKVCGECQG